MDTSLQYLRQQIRQAADEGYALTVRGGGSKDFYGEPVRPAAILDTRIHSGITAYDPDELVITAKAGTPLAEIEAALAERRQILPFEPPHFGAGATLGGAVACGLAGPGRAHFGAVRDFVLGCRLIDGCGQVLDFGGRVVKNVAGYDIHKTMAGAMGTLGVLAEVSLKVLPAPEREITLQFECSAAAARGMLHARMGQPLPLTAGFWDNGVLFVRLGGSAAGVEAAASRLGGERLDRRINADLWRAVREQLLPAFRPSENEDVRLWRVSVPDTAPELELDGTFCMEWGGGLRWYQTGLPADEIRAAASQAGGHATLFRGALRAGETVFTLPQENVLRIQCRLKKLFDPHNILNPGRMPGLA